ncbi:hypothetical protein Patl1_31034 [Pistacia atlantica]|uniref:Uncharacterized protein n=1 Tax=Pistacia atlantica TaxID=434234 RepID=A0ACC1AFX5_9ROSI|nr:hypothetical protein Patl1_31034 [Pistacia atlantica]
MAAALECWSSRTSTDEDMVEQVLMRTNDRSEGAPETSAAVAAANIGPTKEYSSVMQKRFQRLSRNVSEAIASLKNTLNLDSATAAGAAGGARDNQTATSKIESCRKVVWGSVVRNLTQLYPGSQLPEKLVSNIRKHYDSLPLSYAQAGFDMKEVFLHIKLIEQASGDERPAIMIQEVSDDEVQGSVFKLTFACNSSISWPTMSGALDNASICCKKIQIFEKKGFTLGVVLLLVQAGQEKSFKSRIENAIKSSIKKPKQTSVKLPFGLCGCQEENAKGRDFGEIEEESGEENFRSGVENLNMKIQLQMPLPTSSFVVSVDEWQTIQSGGEEIGKWLLNSDNLEFIDQFYGVCVDESHGLCVVTKLMEGGSVHDLMMKNKKLQTKEIIRIAADVAEGIKFMNDHGVAYRDLNTQRILLDRHGNACLGDMGIVTACKSVGEAMEYETDGYRWLAPEIIAGDPESVSETWMSNVYSFGMVIWEMVTGEAAYASFSPVQAAVGIAACGLRPEIPKDCPQMLKSLMTKCWNNLPSKRPQFSEIIQVLLRPNNSNR